MPLKSKDQHKALVVFVVINATFYSRDNGQFAQANGGSARVPSSRPIPTGPAVRRCELWNDLECRTTQGAFVLAPADGPERGGVIPRGGGRPGRTRMQAYARRTAHRYLPNLPMTGGAGASGRPLRRGQSLSAAREDG